ncbi:MAG: DMT family protein [Planctomycetota bacterium]|nr:DMT family protein [Planctomycetota bacterium]
MRALWTILLLFGSNAFMTTAWYYHLKQARWGMLVAIAASWLIALPEYCLQVPANRLGHFQHGGPFTAPQLKVIQEAITLLVFVAFSTIVLREKLRWTDAVGFALVFLGVGVSVLGPRLFGSAS